MNLYLSHIWNEVKATFWMLPALMFLGAFAFSFLTLTLDRSFDGQFIPFFVIWEGGAEGARQLLSTIAGSLITITGVVLSNKNVSNALK